MKPGTQTTLIDDLKIHQGYGLLVDRIIERANSGDYHDLKSELPCPKILLFRDLKLIGLDEIAEKAMSGEYDEL